MSFFSMIFIVSILGAVIGVKKPWMGGIPGLFTTPFLLYFNTSLDIITLIISVLFLSLFGVAYGFISTMIFSGLRGRGLRIGQTFGIGFGAHHPAGIFLSDEEIQSLRDKNIKHEVIFSY
jgi:hypothetical protein